MAFADDHRSNGSAVSTFMKLPAGDQFMALALAESPRARATRGFDPESIARLRLLGWDWDAIYALLLRGTTPDIAGGGVPTEGAHLAVPTEPSGRRRGRRWPLRGRPLAAGLLIGAVVGFAVGQGSWSKDSVHRSGEGVETNLPVLAPAGPTRPARTPQLAAEVPRRGALPDRPRVGTGPQAPRGVAVPPAAKHPAPEVYQAAYQAP
jgi:hypothetical protein